MNPKQNEWVLAITLVAVLSVGCQAPGIGDGDWSVGALVQGVLGQREGDDAPLTASGTIQADEIRVASELGGRIMSVAVEQGDVVQAGDGLVRLDDTRLQTSLLEAEAAVVVAQADLDVIMAGPRVQEIAAAQAALALAAAERDGARSAWESALQALDDPQDLKAQIAKARTQIKLAEQAAILAEAELAKQRLIRDQKHEGSMERDIRDWQVRSAEEKLATSQADLETAQTLHNWLWTIRSRPLALIAQANVAKGQYQIAKAGAVVAQAQLDDLLAGPTPEEVAVAEQVVRLAQARANTIRSQQVKFVLSSPVDGVVLNQSLHAGELAAPAAAILTVADLSRVTLIVYVPENQVGLVQLGQEV